MQKRHALKLVAASALLACSAIAHAQDAIKIANIVELSGPGTTAGTLFKNGAELAIKEINATGGILGKRITHTTEDTQSNPGVAKGLTQKAVDNDVFAIFGPVSPRCPTSRAARPLPSRNKATLTCSAPPLAKASPSPRWRATSTACPRTWL